LLDLIKTRRRFLSVQFLQLVRVGEPENPRFSGLGPGVLSLFRNLFLYVEQEKNAVQSLLSKVEKPETIAYFWICRFVRTEGNLFSNQEFSE